MACRMQTEKDDAESQYNRLEHKVKALNAAKEYKELLKQQMMRRH